jgi:hypothetical protein
MAARLLITGPRTNSGGALFCALCAALYKGEGLARLKDQIDASKKLPADRLAEIPLPQMGSLPQQAVAFGMCQLPMAGQMVPTLAPLCWTHLQGLQTTDGVVPATSMPSGPVLLGQKRLP